MAIDWESMFNEKWKEITPTYDARRQSYETMCDSEVNNLVSQRDLALAALNKTRDEALGNAYSTRRQAERRIPAMLGAQGINGGATETTLSRLFDAQMRANNAANTQYGTDSSELNQNYQNNNTSIQNRYMEALANLDKEKTDEARSMADFAWNAWYQQEQARIAQEQFDRQLQLERDKFDFDKTQAAASSSGGGSSWGSGSASTSSTGAVTNNAVYGNTYDMTEANRKNRNSNRSTNPYGGTSSLYR